MIVVSLVVTAVSFSRYSTTVEGSTQVSVAKPVVEYIPGNLTLNGVPLTTSAGGISLTDVMPGDELAVGLREQNDSGFAGIAVFTADGLSTWVHVYLAQGLFGADEAGDNQPDD